MQPPQPSLLEPGRAWPVRFDSGADPFQRAHHALPGVRDAGRVGRDQAKRGTAGERLAEPQPGADAVGLSSRRGLADHRLTADLGRERQRPRGKRFSTTRGDRELEAWKKDADDHLSNTCSHRWRRNGEVCHSPDARSSGHR